MYIIPETGVENYATALMYITGPASPAPDPHMGGAPAVRGKVDPNAPVSF